MAKKLGYARISTYVGQDGASQKGALERLGAVVVFTETGTGSLLNGRDQLEAAVWLLEPGDELLALHPDCIARDTADFLAVAKRLVERGAALRIHDPNIGFDGTDITAEVTLTLFEMIGMMEKQLNCARQRRGIEAAKRRGAYQGRPTKICPNAMRDLRAGGLSATAIAKHLGIGQASVYGALGS